MIACDLNKGKEETRIFVKFITRNSFFFSTKSFDHHIFYPRFLILRISVHGLSLDTEIVGSWKFQWRRLPFHFCEKLNRPRFKVAIPREGRGQHEGKWNIHFPELISFNLQDLQSFRGCWKNTWIRRISKWIVKN